MSGATVQIMSNYQPGKDYLVFTNFGNISGSFNPRTGLLTLTGVDTIDNYRLALQSVSYTHTGLLVSTISKTIYFAANDGLLNSSSAARIINVSA